MRRMLRFKLRAIDHAFSKARNRKAKTAERIRRNARMIERIKAGSLPFTPEVMSWLSAKLDKKSTRITDGDVKTLVAG